MASHFHKHVDWSDSDSVSDSDSNSESEYKYNYEDVYYKHFQCGKIERDKCDCPCERFGYNPWDTPPLTIEEKQLLHRFTFDKDHRQFTDLQIFSMQTKERFWELYQDLKFPLVYKLLPEFQDLAKNLIYSEKYDFQMERELQKRVCLLKCYYNPRECYENHSGKVEDLMRKDFHQQFNPRFEKQFERNSVPRLKWKSKNSYPSEGLRKLIHNDLGIWSKLSYDKNGIAINFSHLTKENYDYGKNPEYSGRPYHHFETKKFLDVIVALMTVTKDSFDNAQLESYNMYKESMECKGPIRRPILNQMAWGPVSFNDEISPHKDYKCNAVKWDHTYNNVEEYKIKKIHCCNYFSNQH